MARVYKARRKVVCSELDSRERLAAYWVNQYVVKHLSKGRKSSIFLNIAYFMASLPLNRFIPISQICRVKKIKTRILGTCATLQANFYKFSSIVLMNDLQTYG